MDAGPSGLKGRCQPRGEPLAPHSTGVDANGRLAGAALPGGPPFCDTCKWEKTLQNQGWNQNYSADSVLIYGAHETEEMTGRDRK